MFAEKTRKYLEMAMGNVSHADRELQSEIKNELDELERMAKIGEAIKKAFRNNEYCIASYKGNHVRKFTTIDELLQWYREVK